MEILILCALVAAAIWYVLPTRQVIVMDYQKGVVFKDGKFIEELSPGKHWLSRHKKETIYDCRLQSISIRNQELLTQDNLIVKISLVARYQILDVKKITLNYTYYADEFYTRLQLLLRDYISQVPLEDLIQAKQAIDSFMTEQAKAVATAMGLQVEAVNVKDISF